MTESDNEWVMNESEAFWWWKDGHTDLRFSLDAVRKWKPLAEERAERLESVKLEAVRAAEEAASTAKTAREQAEEAAERAKEAEGWAYYLSIA